MSTLRPRSGASLAATLAALILIECVILGTLHLAMAERRVAAAAADLLRLRLAAEATLAEAARLWPDGAEQLPPGFDMVVLHGTAADGLRASASLRRLTGDLYLLRATAAEPAPAVGRSDAAMLLLPPLLPAHFEAADAAAEAEVMLLLPGWPLAPALDSVLLRVAAGRHRLAGRPGVLLLDEDAELDGPVDGVVIAAGNLRLRAGARITGAVLTDGALQVEDAATILGAFIARTVSAAAPFLEADADAAEHALIRAGMRRPDPAPGRFRLPAF